MRRGIVALAAAVLAGALAAAKPPLHPFECPAPKSWAVSSDADGVSMVGPRDEHGLAATISVRYAASKPGLPDADAYVARLVRGPGFKVPGRRREAPVSVTVAGRKATLLAGDALEFPGPKGMSGKEVAMREERVVVPAAKGYYVLFYYAPKSIAKKHHAAFAAALAGFKPAL